VYAFVASAGGSVGLLAGGVLTEAINWHWIFFVNVPIGLATAAAAMRLIARDEGLGLGQGADALGAVLVTSSLMLGVYTIVQPAAEHGWGSTTALTFGAISLALLVAFVARESRARTPLIPLSIFRSRSISGANAIQALSVAGMFGMFFLGSLYLERVLGYSPLEIGMAFLPVTVVMGTLSVRYSEPLVMRFGARDTVLPGMALIVAGLGLFALSPVDGVFVRDVLPAMTLLGAGAGVAFPALMNLAMSGAEPEDAGLASGLVNSSAQVGGALGLAVLATLSSSRTDALREGGASVASALTSGYHLAYLIGAVLVLAAIAVGLTVVRSDRPAAAGSEQFAAEPAVSEAA
jgi:MFS family permease